MTRSARPAGDGRWPVLTNTLARFGALVALAASTLLVARVGGPPAVGLYTLLRVLPGLAGVLLSAGLPGAVAFFLAGPTGSDRRVRPSLVALMAVGGAVGLSLWVVAAPALEAVFFRQLSVAMVAVAAITVPSQLLVATAKSCCQGTGDMSGANWVILLEELLFLPAYPLFRVAGIDGSAAILAALVAADLATAIPAWHRLARRGFFGRERFGRPSVDVCHRVASYGIRGQMGGLLSLVNLRLDHVLLGALAGPGALGAYAVASKFAELVRLAPTAVSYVLYPRFAGEAEERATADARRYIRSVGLLTAASTIPLALTAGLLPLIYGAAFAVAVTPARILLIGLAGEGVAAVVSAYLYGRGRPGLNSLAMGAGVIVTVVLDLALIDRFEAVGAAWASSVAYLTTTAVLVASFAYLTHPLRTSPVSASAVQAGR